MPWLLDTLWILWMFLEEGESCAEEAGPRLCCFGCISCRNTCAGPWTDSGSTSLQEQGSFSPTPTPPPKPATQSHTKSSHVTRSGISLPFLKSLLPWRLRYLLTISVSLAGCLSSHTCSLVTLLGGISLRILPSCCLTTTE